MIITEQVVFEICKSRVDTSKLTGRNYTLCLDGTSCTKKSSILEATEMLVVKNQQYNNNENSDTYFPTMIGYITSGIATLSCGGPHFNDRSPLNVYEWPILWKIMGKFVRQFGNSAVDENNPDILVFLNEVVEIFTAYRESNNLFSSKINTIALIDSNISRCDSLRYLRGVASDKERSTWKFYTALQNLMYKTLYPDLVIDLDWFGDAETDVVVQGIAIFLKSVLFELSSKPNLESAPLIKLKMPKIKEPGIDHTLKNITTHAYRSIGRWGCRKLAYQDDYSIDSENLHSRIPSFINVDNITHPGGYKMDRIPATDCSHLFEADPFYNYDENNQSNEPLIEDAVFNEMF